MKKIIPVALAILLLLCTAVGCSASAKSAAYENSYQMSETADMYYAEAEAPMEAPTEAKAAYGANNAPAPASSSSQALSNRKIIRNADMSIETLAFDAFLEKLIASVESFGGYTESSSIGNRGYRNGQQLRNAHYTIRVPADRLDDFLSAVSELGNVTSINTGLRDVTTNYVDSEKHLESLRVEQQALMEILAKATTVEDIITVQDRLTYVRYEIESYEAILRTYDDQIALSTVSLSVNEVEKETQVEKETFGQEVSRRFKESLESVGEFFRDLGAWLFGSAPEIIVVLVFLGVHVLIVILIVKGIKRRVRKNREKAQKAREAQNNTPKE